REHFTVCFAKGADWFVAGVVAAGTHCPALSISRDAEEKKSRKDLAETFDRASIEAFTDEMRSVRQTLASEPRAERDCGALDIADFAPSDNPKQLKPAAVDLAFLASDADAKDEWEFLTSSWVRQALHTTASPRDRALAITKICRESGPYLVVYDSS